MTKKRNKFRTRPVGVSEGEAVPLGHVEEEDLMLLKECGYNCSSTKAVEEAAIARTITGTINFKKFPHTKIRARYFAQQAGHNNVSVKVIDTKLATSKFLTETLPQDLQIVADVRCHPNIALPYDYFESGMRIYLVSELCIGMNINAYISANGEKDDVIRSIFSQICSALYYAHEHGIYHRNLTPTSIKISGNGHIKIQDFGMSPKLSSVQMSQLHESTKRAYTAPEVIKSRRHESKSADIYSTGIILYEMLHGHVPYTGLRNDILILIFLRDLRFCSSVQYELQQLIRNMLHPDPWKRPHAFTCLDHPWTNGCIKKPLRKLKRPQVSQNTSNLKINLPSTSYEPEHYSQRSQATISCGNEKVVLRSRIPNKLMAYAMDMDYAEMCAQLQSNSEARLEQNLNKMIQRPKAMSSFNSSTASSQEYASDKSSVTTSVTTSLKVQSFRSAQCLSEQIDSILQVMPIKTAPEQPSADLNLETTKKLSNKTVFGSRPASAESEQSVFGVEPCVSDSSFSNKNQTAEASRTPSSKTKKTTAKLAGNSESDTSVSFAPERGSPVPSNVGSIESFKETNHATEANSEGSLKVNEQIDFPAISENERVLKFLSAMPINQHTHGTSLPRIGKERLRQSAGHIHSGWSSPASIKSSPTTPNINQKVPEAELFEGESKLLPSSEADQKLHHVQFPQMNETQRTSPQLMRPEPYDIQGKHLQQERRAHSLASFTSPLCISHKQWSAKGLCMLGNSRRAQPAKHDASPDENLTSLPGPLYNFPLPCKQMKGIHNKRVTLENLLQVSAANVHFPAPPACSMNIPQSKVSVRTGSAVLPPPDNENTGTNVLESVRSLHSRRLVPPVKGQKIQNYIREKAKLAAAELTFSPFVKVGRRYAGGSCEKVKIGSMNKLDIELYLKQRQLK